MKGRGGVDQLDVTHESSSNEEEAFIIIEWIHGTSPTNANSIRILS